MSNRTNRMSYNQGHIFTQHNIQNIQFGIVQIGGMVYQFSYNRIIVLPLKGGLNNCRSSNLADVVKETHLELSAASQCTEPFCTVKPVMFNQYVLLLTSTTSVLLISNLLHAELTWIRCSQDSNQACRCGASLNKRTLLSAAPSGVSTSGRNDRNWQPPMQ